MRSDLFEARGSVPGARVELYNLNFGNASRHFEDAKGLLRRAAERLNTAGQQEDAKRLDPAWPGWMKHKNWRAASIRERTPGPPTPSRRSRVSS